MRGRWRLRQRERPLGAAERGRIVQKVMVEHWTPAEAAATFDLDERLVALWVAEYRRRGMASLRQGREKSTPLRTFAARAFGFLARLRGGLEKAPVAPLEASRSRFGWPSGGREI